MQSSIITRGPRKCMERVINGESPSSSPLRSLTCKTAHSLLDYILLRTQHVHSCWPLACSCFVTTGPRPRQTPGPVRRRRPERSALEQMITPRDAGLSLDPHPSRPPAAHDDAPRRSTPLCEGEAPGRAQAYAHSVSIGAAAPPSVPSAAGGGSATSTAAGAASSSIA